MIPLISPWAEQIPRYGALKSHSAKRTEQAHTTNLSDGWNASNHNPDNLPQVITIVHRILCIEIRELNVHTLAKRWEFSAAACIVFPYGADLAVPLS